MKTCAKLKNRKTGYSSKTRVLCVKTKQQKECDLEMSLTTTMKSIKPENNENKEQTKERRIRKEYTILFTVGKTLTIFDGLLIFFPFRICNAIYQSTLNIYAKMFIHTGKWKALKQMVHN